MPTVTGLSVVTAAFEELEVFQPGQSIPPADTTSALARLNRMISGWAQLQFTIPAIARFVFPLVSGKGGTANPYSIGLGGDLNIAKPANQAAITSVGCLLNASTPPVEIPRGMMTDDGWANTRIKDLTNSLFTLLYYNPTFTVAGLGTVQLWPVPLDATNSLVLYVQQALVAFADLVTVYQVPDGVEDALVYGLAKKLAKPWGSTVDLTAEAMNALKIVKGSNLRLLDLPNDCVTENPRGGYNINTGQ